MATAKINLYTDADTLIVYLVSLFLLSIQVATMANRGGGHRRKVEDVDLYSVLEEHVKSHGLSRALQFGIYENIDRTQAAFAAGLANNKDLLTKV